MYSSISLEPYLPPFEKQEGSLCVSYTCANAVEIMIQQLKGYQPDLNDVAMGEIASEFIGKDKDYMKKNGAQPAQFLEAYKENYFPGTEIKISEYHEVNANQNEFYDTLNGKYYNGIGQPIILASKGRPQVYDGIQYWGPPNPTTGYFVRHAMTLYGIGYDGQRGGWYGLLFNTAEQWPFARVNFTELFGNRGTKTEMWGEAYRAELSFQDKAIFSDIGNLSDADQEMIEKFANIGLVKGFEDGTFKPNEKITRLEMLYIFDRFMKNYISNQS